jgi:DNA replication protein DnaC
MPPEVGREARCPRCEGRGWVVEVDGRAGTARPCGCREEGAVARLLTAAALPPRYRHCKLSNFQTSSGSPGERAELLRARATAERYVEEFLLPGGRFRESGLLFMGPPGVGKTHLAAGVLVELVERFRVHARFADFTALLHQIQSTFDPSSPESKHAVLDPLVGAELLVLDELGAQQPTPWVRDILYLIINHRYTRRLPTLFTTNYRLEPAAAAAPARARDGGPARPASLDRGAEPAAPPPRDEAELLGSRLPPMLVSRLYEMVQPVALTGVEDFRREHKVHGAHMR